jgi:hypothetical protein
MDNNFWVIEGTYVDKATKCTIFGREHWEFQAFLRTLDDTSEQNINLLLPIDCILTEIQEHVDGVTTLHLQTGTTLHRKVINSYTLGNPNLADRCNTFFVEDFVRQQPQLDALPAS